MSDDDRLDQIEARASAATEGPWANYGDGNFEVHTAYDCNDGEPGSWISAGHRRRTDAEFIAHARDDVPWLVEQVRELQAALAEQTERADHEDRCAVQYQRGQADGWDEGYVTHRWWYSIGGIDPGEPKPNPHRRTDENGDRDG